MHTTTAPLPAPTVLDPAAHGAAGSYGARLPLTVAAVAHGASALAADVAAAALAVERVERVWAATLRVLERAVDRLDERASSLDERNGELGRCARASAEPVAAQNLRVASARLEAVLRELRWSTRQLRTRVELSRRAVAPIGPSGAVMPTPVALAEAAVAGVRQAVAIGDGLVAHDNAAPLPPRSRL